MTKELFTVVFLNFPSVQWVFLVTLLLISNIIAVCSGNVVSTAALLD